MIGNRTDHPRPDQRFRCSPAPRGSPWRDALNHGRGCGSCDMAV